MKSFAVFATLIALSCAAPQNWNLYELSEDQPQYGFEVSTWSLHEISEALLDPSTDPAHLPYLEDGLNSIMADLIAGGQQDSITIAIPIANPAVNPIAVNPIAVNPIAVNPIAVNPVLNPVVPALNPVIPAESPASPLVQIIVNIKQQETSAPAVPIPTPVESVVAPPAEVSPVNPPEAIINPIDVIAIAAPELVNPVDVIAITPPEAIINPIDVIAIAAPELVNPVDVIAITPPQAIINPIDVIAIAAPEVNPIDLMIPVPVVPVAAATDFGPIL